MSYQKEACPICGEGSLSNADYERKVEHNGKHGSIITHISICDTCGCEQASPSQVRDNRREFTAFQKRVENRLSGKEIKQIRKKLNLKQNEASKLFGGGANSFAKYETDDVTQSDAMDKLIRICSEVPQAYAWLVRHCKAPSLKKPLQVPTIGIDFFRPFTHSENNVPVFVEDSSACWTITTGTTVLIDARDAIESSITSVAILKNTLKPAKPSIPVFKEIEHSRYKAYTDSDYEKYAAQGSHQ
ncbi:type II toxin-antitoxin system MqsA family antitoxin [Pseudomonas zeae]|uniref:Type II toxin-antitoxin system MqsA family antitoxin n=1 Tax=Pseudomonas zeae TaxID=2745510 RepID=A0ABU5BSE0_9PSED|nr:type II toxin-antitoxin system MqsA family antitoxin [Pseudomonas zeae]MDX9679356.1 type II toxin-antitoxin system MqsA family antitoxin [Pseudomonas zeae]